MSTTASLTDICRQLDTPRDLGSAFDELLATRQEPPSLLALGEPTHGIAAFPLLRNELLCHLVERGYRSIALETDILAASVVDDYVGGGATEIDDVLERGFSHGFGRVPGNRELVEWLRGYNTDRPARNRVRFYGFDAPVEFSGAPSPRHALSFVLEYLPAALHPDSARDVDGLFGDDTDWTNPAAMVDPAASIGDSERARALRLVADDLVSVLCRAAPVFALTDPVAYADALTYARTARGLLRYHAAMARTAPDRIATLLSLRADMMAENLLAIVSREKSRGPSLVFAHNAHLQRMQSSMPVGAEEAIWGSAGALVGLALGERYVFVAADAGPHSRPGTLQGALAEATARRALFPAKPLHAALPRSIGTGEPLVRGHIPLSPADVERADAIVFVADTDGHQHRYW
ncbi:erythromycin esterase family protein [Rhodococcus sp. NPDC058639]|uniref:erythromycin esterase family protein n=1 Tax=Rhodococcus sp. NPDC058639 TaxID=3346570 RepID=UPI0036625EBF